jgi:hypothetical protein
LLGLVSHMFALQLPGDSEFPDMHRSMSSNLTYE